MKTFWLLCTCYKMTTDTQPANHPLNQMLESIAQAIGNYPKAAMFELYDRGFTTLFEQLMACIISVRTLDETTIPVSLRVFAAARTPQQMATISIEALENLLYGSTFPAQKAKSMLDIAKTTVDQYDGALPANYTQLTALKGVGPKCANLALGVAANKPAISVDVHVHRVVNRWGYVTASTPEKSLSALQTKVPEALWIEINKLLMPFGKHVCTSRLPRCTECPVLKWCDQIGVTDHR